MSEETKKKIGHQELCYTHTMLPYGDKKRRKNNCCKKTRDASNLMKPKKKKEKMQQADCRLIWKNN